MLAERREAGAPGGMGGQAGRPGEDAVFQNGQWQALEGTAQLEAGGKLRVRTPGGGGWGPATAETAAQRPD